jgi:type II secretory pathway component PulJ
LKTTLHNARAAKASGLTILEMLVATTLLVVIVLGLTAMFLQTQKAFRSGFTQSDVMESGRTVVDMMSRDLQQMSDAKDPYITNFFYGVHSGSGPLVQSDGLVTRTNYLSDVFTLEHINGTWFGVGYAISNAISGGNNSMTPIVGTLYRFTYATNDLPTQNPLDYFLNQSVNFGNNFNRIIDGVVHFQVRAFDAYGQEMVKTNALGILWLPDSDTADNISNSLPNSVELELGILEPSVLEQVRAFGANNITAQTNFLKSRIGAVHIFRQQIPVRTALPR